jgi:hypothetical protein
MSVIAVAHNHVILGIETRENRARRISYLWVNEKRGFWAASPVVARDQLRGQQQNVMAATANRFFAREKGYYHAGS